MSLGVSRQVAAICEPFATLLALVWLLARVNAHVPLHG